MNAHDTQEDRPDEFADEAMPDSDSQDEEDGAGYAAHVSVGDILRMRREALGQTLEDVVEAVRIQRRYIEALEGGRIDDLPGTVYALGFVRTYAEHLGFDGPELVARFKEETIGSAPQAQSLAMPEPLEEGKVPTAAIVIVAIVLAVGGYVGWYAYNNREPEVAQTVPEVPAHLATVVEEKPPVQQPEAAAEPAPQEQAAEAPPEPEAPKPVAPVVEESTSVVAAPAAPELPPVEAAPVQPVEAVSETPVETAPVRQAETPVQPAPTPVPEAGNQPPEAENEAETPVAEDLAALQPQSGDAEAAESPVTPEEEAVHVPRTYGLANSDARIVITAVEDSWIEITDAEGARLLSRTLRTGDKYQVPDREGLFLVTGNAGGLAITVDGDSAPRLGDIGIVRKNVKLDPVLLSEGRAWP